MTTAHSDPYVPDDYAPTLLSTMPEKQVSDNPVADKPATDEVVTALSAPSDGASGSSAGNDTKVARPLNLT